MKGWRDTLQKSAVLLGIMILLCGILYPVAITGLGQLFFHSKVNGSMITVDGVNYGSELLGQRFTKAEHLWGRIVLPDVSTFSEEEGGVQMYGAASNLSPAGKEFEAAVAERVKVLQEANLDADRKDIPVELVTCSGSGLDPHISPAAAEYQVPRIAQTRGIEEAEVRDVIQKYTKGKLFGILGEKTVNVLLVNLALDGILTD